MNWSAHIHYIKNKISKSIGILFKIRNFLDNHTLRSMYFTFIYPYLIYCVEVWGNTHDCHLDPPIKIQNSEFSPTSMFINYYIHFLNLKDDLLILA